MSAHDVKHGLDAAMEQKRERIGKVLEAFRRDKFDANEFMPTDVGAETRKALGPMIDFAEALLPTLTPEQRERAADLVRTHAASAPKPGKEEPPPVKPGQAGEEEQGDEDVGTTDQELVFGPPIYRGPGWGFGRGFGYRSFY